MCGIAGGWWPQASGPIEEKLQNAVVMMRHRGPDDRGIEQIPVASGVVALAHTRLSIIDLSVAGHQPIRTEDGRYVLVFNGEIYNYRELRAELTKAGYIFRSNSDTEVLLLAWKHWGEKCLTKLTGMFAFVVLDIQDRILTCARDPFGIKPFYYCYEGGNFLFSSEIGALTEIKAENPKLNWQRAYDYLVHGDYDSSPNSFVSGVENLLPGCMLTIDLMSSGVGCLKRWWTPGVRSTGPIHFEEATEVLRDKFLNNIRLHLRSDVPLGAALSGGIDSSAVVCAMRHVEPDLPINTFSYIARGCRLSEEHWVDLVNAHVGATPNKIYVSGKELADDLDDLIRAQGEPFGSTSIYAQYRIFKEAKERGVTVTLDGQGADELLAGYSGFPGQRIHSLIDDRDIVGVLRFADAWAEWPGRTRLGAFKEAISEIASGSLYHALRYAAGKNDVPKWLRPGPLREAGVKLSVPVTSELIENCRGRRLMAKLVSTLTSRGLPALLRHADRNSMQFSIESRVPFLTPDMAEFLLSLPEDFLISKQGETKSIFRAAMRGIVPDEILDRRDKIGFETPEKDWLLSIADTVRTWLREDLKLRFIDQVEVLKEFDLVISGKKVFSWQVWRWINFYRWYITGNYAE